MVHTENVNGIQRFYLKTIFKGLGQLISKGHFGVFKSTKSHVSNIFERISNLASKKRLGKKIKVFYYFK